MTASAAQPDSPRAGDRVDAPDEHRGWDCHAHLFGPYAHYPLAEGRSYTPPEALESQYAALLARLGLGHGVLVHPSAYGADHRRVLDALASRPRWRGVLVAGADAAPALAGMRERGVRALRFSHRSGTAVNFAGSASLGDLEALAPALADAGMHAELWTDCRALPSIAQRLRALPMPVVIDHMGMFDPTMGPQQPGFDTLRALLAAGRTWVKLCAYRNLLALPDREAWSVGKAFQDALVAANPERVIWGSDWPHLNVAGTTDTAALLQLFKDWAGDAQTIERVLVTNPEALYR
jgi:predicted TIM-barrel fold metal-dependent hydrolase